MDDQLRTPQPQPPNIPESNVAVSSPKNRRSTFLYVLLAIILIVGAGYGGYQSQHNKVKSLNNKLTSLSNQAITTKTYTDTTTKASFSYPSNWVLSSIVGLCDHGPGATCPGAVELTAPDNNLSLIWSSSGAGGADGPCDQVPISSNNSDGCDVATIFSSTPIPNSSGLYVVDGVVQASVSNLFGFGIDSPGYEPFIMVQSKNGLTASGYIANEWGPTQEFQLTGSEAGRVFMMGGYPSGSITNYTDVLFNTNDTSLTTAKQFFTSTDAKQAQQILLSLKD